MCKLLFIALIVPYLVETRSPLPDATDENFQKECNIEHNKYRSLHENTPTVKISQELIKHAKKRLSTITTFEKLDYIRNGNAKIFAPYGENVFRGHNDKKRTTCAFALKSWYKGREIYSKPIYTSKTGQFTQIVWVKSIEVGCARSMSKPGAELEVYIVCSYNPPGNSKDDFAENVMKNKPKTSI
ncbi:uncharacterized protein LOC128959403 [Oppia nitens]|uniref:uncharacterized protein LOC128959403 n=1 Tax=Oppia nitens TaxID=1686743 RepID=UPI0023DBD7F3|nr:uncharacterized protein LOC128959403 [Oppia nitens]